MKIIKNIEIRGNERIPDETILMFSGVKINESLDDLQINSVLKNLYNSNFLKCFS